MIDAVKLLSTPSEDTPVSSTVSELIVGMLSTQLACALAEQLKEKSVELGKSR